MFAFSFIWECFLKIFVIFFFYYFIYFFEYFFTIFLFCRYQFGYVNITLKIATFNFHFYPFIGNVFSNASLTKSETHIFFFLSNDNSCESNLRYTAYSVANFTHIIFCSVFIYCITFILYIVLQKILKRKIL